MGVANRRHSTTSPKEHEMNFTTAGIEREIEAIENKIIQIRAATVYREKTIDEEIQSGEMLPFRLTIMQRTLAEDHAAIQHLTAIKLHLGSLKGKFSK